MLRQLQDKLQPFRNQQVMVVRNQGVGDIIQGILSTHNQWSKEYDKIASSFIGHSERDTLQNIWEFLKKNVRYNAESEGKQMLKSPSAILATGRTTGSDCKNYSLFTAGILAALARKGYKIPFSFRFASYRLNDKIPQHVFVVAYPKTNNEVWIDAVLPTFDNRKQYFYSIDRKPKEMSLYGLSGIEDNSIGRHLRNSNSSVGRHLFNDGLEVHVVGGFFSWVKEKFKDAKKDLTRPDLFHHLSNEISKGFHEVVMKYNPLSAIARNAFLLLCEENVHSLAGNLQKMIDTDPNGKKKLTNMWYDIGGTEGNLLAAIRHGSHKKSILGIDDETVYETQTVVGEPVTLTTALVTASGIVAKVLSIMKEAGISPEKLKNAITDVFKKKKETILSDIQKEKQGIQTTTGDKILANEQAKASKKKTMLYVGGALAVGAGIYFMTKKGKK
jgi:hypothetical protein